MESLRLFKKNVIPPAHLPTALLFIGYGVYWIELTIIKRQAGLTSPLAFLLFFLVCFFSFTKYLPHLRLRSYQGINQILKREKIWFKVFLASGLMAILAILVIGFFAALLPPHLPQENDALRYHLSLPRQHLILNGFWSHITWEWADLAVMPVAYALAPYCFVDVMPNKIAHFIIFLGLVAVTLRLAARFSRGNFRAVTLVALALIGSHFIGIQIGTAMLDIVICYLFLAFLDSFLAGNRILGMIEFVFFFWAKPFNPLMTILIVLGLAGIAAVGMKFFKAYHWGLGQDRLLFSLKKFGQIVRGQIIPFLVLSLLIAGPFLVKSLYYAGTPLYPFGTGALLFRDVDRASPEWQNIEESSRFQLGTKDWYGYGKSLPHFIRHFWLISVPDQGVNNKFDYPVGLPYLLLLGPFFLFLIQGITKRDFMVLPFFIILFWALWWLGLQQTRFLYIPVTLMFILAAGRMPKPSKILWIFLLLSVLFNAVSLLRSHKCDLFRGRYDVLDKSDQEILELNRQYLASGRTDTVTLPFPEVSFARFPVNYKPKK